MTVHEKHYTPEEIEALREEVMLLRLDVQLAEQQRDADVERTALEREREILKKRLAALEAVK